MVNSRDKGKVGEREAAAFLTEHGFEARRGQQFKGGDDSPDVIHSMVDLGPWGDTIYLEVKRRETFSNQQMADALSQADDEKEKPDDIPAVMFRRNRTPWTVTLYAADFCRLMQHLRDHDVE